MLRAFVIFLSLAYATAFTPDCKEDGFIGDPKNCSIFYACADGVAYTMACADGLHFNPVTLVCDWPESAGCSVESTEPTTTQPSSSICQGLNDTLVADPEDCHGFYSCGDGFEVLMRCPGSLYFNPVLQACDWPENTNCTSQTTNSSRPLQCDASNEGASRPEEGDCQVFYVCSHGIWYNITCPNGTHYNPGLKVCDWPKNAGCQRFNDSKTPTVCDGVLPGKSELVPDPEDCGKFYSCANGNSVSMDCPERLHFNYYNQTCDWPENSGCIQHEFTTEVIYA